MYELFILGFPPARMCREITFLTIIYYLSRPHSSSRPRRLCERRATDREEMLNNKAVQDLYYSVPDYEFLSDFKLGTTFIRYDGRKLTFSDFNLKLTFSFREDGKV